jgi:SAM-dependent methyltransferase
MRRERWSGCTRGGLEPESPRIGVNVPAVSGTLVLVATDDARMRAYYEQGKERDRLAGSKGALEFERTTEILQRRMPPAPAAVADIGGGPGRYAVWLAELGYTVQHRDLMDLHVDQLRALGHPSIQTGVGDARHLDLPDSSVDAVLLLGPLYHLPERQDRIRTLQEAARIVRGGGPIFVAVISRWAPRLDGVLQERLYEQSPAFLSLLPEVERTGSLPPVVPNGFVGYTHRPGDLADEVAEAGLQLDDLVGVEGLPLAATDMASRLGDPTAWNVLLDAARAIERVPELLGLSPHLIATATRAPG